MFYLSSLLVFALLFTVHATVLHSVESVSKQSKKLCGGGQFRARNGACKLCPPGTYRLATSRSNKCTACKPGTFQPLFGVSRKYLCRSCYPGTFTGHFASSKCYKCPAGKSSGFAAAKCVRCKPGTFVSFSGATCERCDASSFSSTFNAKQCELCLDGKLNAQRSKCDTCKAGDSCFKCPSAMYRNLDTGHCEECPLGTTTKNNNDADSVEDCRQCEPGFYRGLYDYDCYACDNGKQGAPSKGAMQCKDDNGKCPHGYFVSADGVCVTCADGEFRNLGTNRCEVCAQGSVSNGGVDTKCTKCLGNTFPSKDRRECTCKDGFHIVNGQCTACNAGTYRNNEQHLAQFGCEACLPGWVSKKGAAKCERCAYGSVSNKKRTMCYECSAGSIPNLLSYIDLYYDYGQSKCINGRNGHGQGGPPILYH